MCLAAVCLLSACGDSSDPISDKTSTDAASMEERDPLPDISSELKTYLSTRRACASDDHCVLVPVDCPLGCGGVAAASEHAEDVGQKVDELIAVWDALGVDCDYTCLPPDGVVCRNDSCENLYESRDAAIPCIEVAYDGSTAPLCE
jgi:hypothetical protein